MPHEPPPAVRTWQEAIDYIEALEKAVEGDRDGLDRWRAYRILMGDLSNGKFATTLAIERVPPLSPGTSWRFTEPAMGNWMITQLYVEQPVDVYCRILVGTSIAIGLCRDGRMLPADWYAKAPPLLIPVSPGYTVDVQIQSHPARGCATGTVALVGIPFQEKPF